MRLKLKNHPAQRNKNERRNSILMTCLYLYLGSTSDWWNKFLLARPVRSPTHIWLMTQNTVIFIESAHWRKMPLSRSPIGSFSLLSPSCKVLTLLTEKKKFGSLSSDVHERRTWNGSGVLNSSAVILNKFLDKSVSLRVKTLSYRNLVASRLI